MATPTAKNPTRRYRARMAEPLKLAFDAALVDRLGAAAAATLAGFDRKAFGTAATAGLDDLELKDRVNHIADALRAGLPHDWAAAATHVVAMADAAADGASGWGDMGAWPLTSVIERHGLDEPEVSLAAMERVTRAFSCEFAIRPYLTHHLDLTLEHCRRWVGHTDPAVRRLPSEGTRPHLPWGGNVTALLDDPEIGIALITELRHDPDEVVRRSVANHLNDIARRHPDRVVEICAAWSADGVDAGLIRHALRSLVKKGHPGALGILGFTTEADIEVESFSVTPSEISLGESIVLDTRLRSTSGRPQRLVVDFVVHHVNANGETSPKVFKWTTVDLAADATADLTKRRRIATASTRRYHAGTHRVALQVAGSVVASTAFELLDSST